MYFSTNTRPDISYAVHQCARFIYAPKHTHALAINIILRYLKGTRTKGIHISSTGYYNVDCFVDDDFVGLWGSENKQDSICVTSRTGFVIMFMGCPLLCISKLQT